MEFTIGVRQLDQPRPVFQEEFFMRVLLESEDEEKWREKRKRRKSFQRIDDN